MNLNSLKATVDGQGLEIQRINDKIIEIKNELEKLYALESSFKEFKDYSMNKFAKNKEKVNFP